MIGFAVSRLGWALLTAFVASIITFVLFWTVPNVDPAYLLGGEAHGTERRRAPRDRQYGLDDPLPVQYARLMKAIISGASLLLRLWQPGRRSSTRCRSRLRSIFGAAVLRWAGIGLRSDLRPHRGRCLTGYLTGAVAAYSIPSARAVGPDVGLPLLPVARSSRSRATRPLTEDPLHGRGTCYSPWIAAASVRRRVHAMVRGAAQTASTRNGCERLAPRACPRGGILRRHVLRNALISPASLWDLDFSHAFGGFLLYVEVIFGLPGSAP